MSLSKCNLQSVPEKFHKEINDFLIELDQKMPKLAQIFQDNQNVQDFLTQCAISFPYLRELSYQKAYLFVEITTIQTASQAFAYYQNKFIEYNTTLKQIKIESDFASQLRHYKKEIHLLCAYFDFTNIWSTMEATQALSNFADLAVSETLNFLHKENGITTEKSKYIVLSLGKLGGHELNYSSDIDLAVFYDSYDVHDAWKKHKQHIKITQKLISILQNITADGYVFRVDLRLRPNPSAHPIVLTFPTAYQYYESVGQNWERAAYIKARQIAGDPTAGAKFLRFINKFIWRKNLDFQSIRDIHSIKRQIHNIKGSLHFNLDGFDLKIGRGGIRDIEFFAQTHQLIYAGRIKNLRSLPTLQALEILSLEGIISNKEKITLSENYIFYRDLEHKLQVKNDEQTHNLPTKEEDWELLWATYFPTIKTVAELKQTIKRKLVDTANAYDGLFTNDHSLAAKEGSLSFTGSEDNPETLKTLKKMGFQAPALISQSIRKWHHGQYKSTNTARSRQILTEITPTLLKTFAKQDDCDKSFNAFDRFIEHLPAGVQLFSLLESNPKLIELFSELLGNMKLSEWLIAQPELMDNLLDPAFFKEITRADEEPLEQEAMERVTYYQDLEDRYHEIVRWCQDKKFKALIHHFKGFSTHDDICHYNATIADIVLKHISQIALEQLSQKHGSVPNSDFCIISFGKLGQKLLNYQSDLDIILTYNLKENNISNGSKSLMASEYFIRLARRITALLSVQTPYGKLYDIDMRLRPSGNAGPVAVNFDSFKQYHLTEAWTWERMALCNSRVSYSTSKRGYDLFENFLNEIFSQKLDCTKLQNDIIEMREKLLHTKKHGFKYVSGGIVDLSFLTQYLILRYAASITELPQRNIYKNLSTLFKNNAIDNNSYKLLEESYRKFLELQTWQRLHQDKDETILENIKSDLTKVFELYQHYLPDERLKQ